jgi:Flp pilus assembly protein TadG
MRRTREAPAAAAADARVPEDARVRDERHGECGSASIEFALVFPLFFFLIYGGAHYGLIFALSISMNAAASDAARAALAADPEDANFATLVQTRARAAVVSRLDWLPAAQRAAVLGASGEKVDVEIEADATLGNVVRVAIHYPDYATSPLLPRITFPVLGAIPPLPAQLGAQATAQL